MEIIKNAFVSESIEFQREWLECKIAPDKNLMSKKFTNRVIRQTIDKINVSELNPYDFTIEVLKFQIAELYRMKDKQLKNGYRYFGVQSETENYWYNFDPFWKFGMWSKMHERQ